MKNFLLCLLLVVSFAASAQIVTIPDANFKARLLLAGDHTSPNLNLINARNVYGNTIKIDANNDGEIQETEAAQIYKINISNISVSSIQGLEAFVNLKEILFAGFNISSLVMPQLTSLERFSLSSGNVYSLNVSQLVNIKELIIRDCKFPTLDVSNLASLTFVSHNPNTTVVGQSVHLTSVNLQGAVSLKEINFGNNKLTNIDLTGLVNLEIISLQDNLLTGIDISQQVNIKKIFMDNNDLMQLNIGNKPKLERLDVKNNHIQSLDLSGCPVLISINASLNNLNYINIKNGGPLLLGFSVFSNPPGELYICTDEGEDQWIASRVLLLNLQSTTLHMNSYCSFTPGGNYNTITGTFTFDGDNNGCSLSDAPGKNIRVSINDGTQTGSTITNASGNYSFYTQTGNFIVTPQFENNWFTATPAAASVNFTNNNNNTSTQNFCIAPNGVHPDVEVVLVPEGSAQPGFDARYKILFKNKGNQTLSGNIVLNYNEDVLDYVALGSTLPTLIASGQLTWAYSNLQPFESRIINVWFNLNGPMETPPVNLDDVLNYTVSISPTTGDETPADNTFALNQIVTGSYDPNDITCLEGESVHPNKIGDYLHYNINFENTGNAPATFIVVKDLINAQQYDINTLQMLYASHNVETRINGNKVEFFFDDINLGPQAKGNVVLKIKTQPNVAINSSVMNKAEIFFDYNWPIVTNEAETTFAVLSSGNFAVDNSVSIYPNPAITNVNIKASAEITSAQLYDVQGRLLQLVPMSGSEAVLDVTGRASGTYFLKVMTDKGIKVEKLIRK